MPTSAARSTLINFPMKNISPISSRSTVDQSLSSADYLHAVLSGSLITTIGRRAAEQQMITVTTAQWSSRSDEDHATVVAGRNCWWSANPRDQAHEADVAESH